MARIKGNAGITLAQDPNEAEYGDMPQHAIATGLIDFVEPLKRIAQRLVSLAKVNPQVKAPSRKDSLSVEDRRLLEKILMQVEINCQQDFSVYKVSTIMRRIRRRMQLQGIELLSEYLHLLRSKEDECALLFDDLLITVTNFFRDQEVFASIEDSLIPKLFEGKGKNDTVRIRVNGCSTGEEASSIAMLLHEHAAGLSNPPPRYSPATSMKNRSPEGEKGTIASTSKTIFRPPAFRSSSRRKKQAGIAYESICARWSSSRRTTSCPIPPFPGST